MSDTPDDADTAPSGAADHSELDAEELSLAGRRRRRAIYGLGAFILLAAVAFAALGSGGGDGGGEGHLDVAYETVDGDEVVLADFAGEPMVVNFFASWCAPCRAEMPDFETVHQAFRGDVRFVGLALNDRAGDALEIVESTGVTYDWGIDVDGKIFEAYEATAVMPTTVFVAADGRISEIHAGILTAAELTDRVEDLIS